MKLSISCLAVASTITIVTASSCTSDVALAWPFTPDDSDNGGSDDGPVGTNTNNGGSSGDCNGDINCEAINAGIAAEGQCNALGLVDDSDTTCAEKLKLLKRTVNLDCTGSEKCYAFLDDSLLCMVPGTGMLSLGHKIFFVCHN